MKWIAILGMLAGCIDVHLVECAGNIACPIGDLCDDLHHGCATPDQLSVCAGRADGDGCVASSINGGCFDGVCLPRGCGNRVVEPGEVCDDGNQLSGDGCRSDCQSSETCGNGVRDPGEECDDGNLMSRDGCDSRCLAEHGAWSDVGLPPPSVSISFSSNVSYDEARGRLVVTSYSERGVVWEWDGQRWSLIAADSLLFGFSTSYYDPDRARVVVVGQSSTDFSLAAVTWDGTAWTRISTGIGPNGYAAVAIYDRARHQPVIIEAESGGQHAYTLDAQAAWIPLPDAPVVSAGMSSGFDSSTGEVVLLANFPPGHEIRFDGVTWTTASPTFGTSTVLSSQTFDPTSGHLVVVDGDNGVFERVAGVWQPVAGSPPCPNPGYLKRVTYFDAHDSGLVIMDPHGNEACTRIGDVWSDHRIEVPLAPIAVAEDPTRRRFVVVDAYDPSTPDFQTWSWDGGWLELSPPSHPTPRSGTITAYDPVRGRIILYGGYGQPCPTCAYGVLTDTWDFDGETWSLLDDQGPAVAPSSLGYDPIRRVLLLVVTPTTGPELWELASDGHQWSHATAPPAYGSSSVAWDARNDRMVMAGYGLLEQIGGVWKSTILAPMGSYFLVADARTGGLILITRNPGTNDIWERLGDQWQQLPSSLMAAGNRAAFDSSTGRVLAVGTTASLVYQRSSATPVEICDAVDRDGDGLIGCADPDCWWACTPACPPYTTCP